MIAVSRCVATHTRQREDAGINPLKQKTENRMNSLRQVKAVAKAIGASKTIPSHHRRAIAVDIADALLWTGRWRRQFLTLVDEAVREEVTARKHP